MTTPSSSEANLNQLKAARALRESALQALREAQAIDGLMPHVVIHGHEYGSSAYLYWDEDRPIDILPGLRPRIPTAPALE